MVNSGSLCSCAETAPNRCALPRTHRNHVTRPNLREPGARNRRRVLANDDDLVDDPRHLELVEYAFDRVLLVADRQDQRDARESAGAVPGRRLGAPLTPRPHAG